MSDTEKEQLRVILGSIYNDQTVSSWTMNNRVYRVLVEMMKASSQCTFAMHFVPRPAPFGGNPTTWLAKEAVKALLRYFSDDENKHYLVCLKVSASKYRTKIQLAGMGL